MPMNSFTKKAIELRYDVEALAEAFSSDVDAVCRRLNALPPGENIPKIGYFRANAAGTTVEALGVEGLNIPKYSSACPLWVLYRAQQSPEAFIRQRALFPWGARFIFVARARNTGTTGFGKPAALSDGYDRDERSRCSTYNIRTRSLFACRRSRAKLPSLPAPHLRPPC